MPRADFYLIQKPRFREEPLRLVCELARKAYDANWAPQLRVIKGQAGAPDKDPHHVDGLSGATITSNGITRVVRFWLSSDGYAPFLKTVQAKPTGAPA